MKTKPIRQTSPSQKTHKQVRLVFLRKAERVRVRFRFRVRVRDRVEG